MTSTQSRSWISGDDMFLARVRPTLETINDRSAWQYFAGSTRDGGATWSSLIDDARPIASCPARPHGLRGRHLRRTIEELLMCVTDGWPTMKEMSSYVLESESLTGQWRMAVYLEDYGKRAHFLNFPSKFISPDGRRAWLCYSANFTSQDLHPEIDVDPAGSRYAMCLLELEVRPAEIG